LLGLNKDQLLTRNITLDWIEKHQNAGLQLLEREKDFELAKSIFIAWDTTNKGYLSLEELTEKLIGIGLYTTIKIAGNLLMSINRNTEILTLKDFLKVFDYDKIG